jgi:hypothetical protein
MKRIKFKSNDQRKFLKEVLKALNCPTLKAFDQFGFNIPYSTMKNYFTEKRTLPEQFFNDLISLTKINKTRFQFKVLEENFGQRIGGKKSKRKIKYYS